MPIRVPPPLLAALAALAQEALIRIPCGGAGRSPTPASRAAATAVAAPAGAVLLASLHSFRTRRTTLNPVAVTGVRTLVQVGPHRRSRNPMYVAMVALLAAHALWHRRALALIPVAVFVSLIDRFQIPAEEAALTARFGAEYERYRAAVPRWLAPRSLTWHPPGERRG